MRLLPRTAYLYPMRAWEHVILFGQFKEMVNGKQWAYVLAEIKYSVTAVIIPWSGPNPSSVLLDGLGKARGSPPRTLKNVLLAE